MSTSTSVPATAQWFALHTLSGQENKVKNYIEKFKKAEELDDAIFEVLLPTEVVSEVKNGKKTTKVESRSSVRVGQVAFWSSPTISPRKMRVLLNGFFMGRNLAGAEGIEPPTNGFGDRYSTN